MADTSPKSAHWNFSIYVLSHWLSRTGDTLMNPKTTLVWLAASLGVSPLLQGLLVPVREAGSLILQPLLSGLIKGRRYRRGLWSLGALGQGAAVAGMAAVAWRAGAAGDAPAAWPGPTLLGLLALFALARGLSSVTSKDVLGRSLPQRLRGRAGGLPASLAGLTVLAAAGFGLGLIEKSIHASTLALWLLAATAAWWLAAGLFLGLREPAAVVDVQLRQAAMTLLLRDRLLRRFVIARGLLLCSALAPPYLVSMAQQHSAEGRSLLLFVLAGGVAALFGGLPWGRLADRSSRLTLSLAALLAASSTLAAALLALFLPQALQLWWALPLAFLLISLAHEGVRIGRKTWIVNIATDGERVDYVAVSNAAMGGILLAVGGITAGLAVWSVPAVLLTLSAAAVAGALLGLALPEAERSDDQAA